MSVVNLQDIKNKKIQTVEWAKLGYKKEGETYPLKVWQNLECVLLKHGINVRLNLINHDIDYNGLNSSNTRNGAFTDIYSLQVEEGLNLSRDECFASVKRIAEKNAYNPFLELLHNNENNNFKIIREVFNCLEINDDNEENLEYYFKIFTKWCLNVVKLAHNTLENDYSGQGILVLQGGQGCFKSTFCRKLMPNQKWFKGDKSLDPEKVDSIMQNTKYILVEWGELDSTLKGEQAKLKQFITATNDEYRSPYDRVSEKYPRITSYIGTVNKKDFLKDETGSRRFWIIPVVKCDIDKLDKIDLSNFWGAIYAAWKSGKVKDYLTREEQDLLANINSKYSYENDISILLNERLDWEMDKAEWSVYNITELCEYFMIREKKALKTELERRGIEYKSYRNRIGGVKKGFKLPRYDVKMY